MRLKVRNRLFAKRELYASHQAEFYYVEGEVIPTPKWVDYEAVTVRTGDGKFDFRIVEAAMIVEMDGSSFVAALTPKASTIEVKGSKGNIYTVTIGAKYSSCTCQAFQFRRSCKHIKEATAA
jgi:hypothetical protein